MSPTKLSELKSRLNRAFESVEKSVFAIKQSDERKTSERVERLASHARELIDAIEADLNKIEKALHD